mgnify:CR=1 FL=1
MELNKENLTKCYLTAKLSTRECAKVFEVTQSTILRRMKKYHIKGRPYTENKTPNPKGSHLSEKHKKAISEHHKNDPNLYMRGRYLDKHPNWQGGKRAYRRLKLSEAPLACSLCGQTEIIRKNSNLHVHHIDCDRSNNALDNLQVLCASCHRKVHNSM